MPVVRYGASGNLARRRLLTQKGDRVRFSLADAFLPGAEELAVLATPGEKVEGTIVNFSDSGAKLRCFAVIDVIRRRAVVVPLDKVEVVHDKHPDFLD
jgi:hypothetical protein